MLTMKHRASAATTLRPQPRLTRLRSQRHQNLRLQSQAQQNQVLRSLALLNQLQLSLNPSQLRQQLRRLLRSRPLRQLQSQALQSLLLRSRKHQSPTQVSQAHQSLVLQSRAHKRQMHQSLILQSQVRRVATSQPHAPCLSQAAPAALQTTHFLPVAAQAIVLHLAQVEQRVLARSHRVATSARAAAQITASAITSRSLVARVADVAHHQQ